jgi:hypothetical protein
MKQEIKTIGSSGQLYLGKQYAGQHVVVTEERQGVWLIKTAEVIPHDEKWLHSPENEVKLASALEWAQTTPAAAATTAEMESLFKKALKK